MLNNTRNWLACGLVAATALMLAGCPSAKRVVLEGYTDEMLNGKRVLVLVPDAADVTLADPGAYAYARGASSESARDQLANDLQSRVVSSLAALLDSNNVLGYKDQPVGGIVTLNAKSDFNNAGPVSWDVVKRAGREGNMDFLVVLNGMSIRNTASTSGGRGGESITAHYLLLDAQRGKTMSQGEVSVDVKELQSPGDAYQRLAQELGARFPFVTGMGAGK
jgi:hypothetical protein